MPRSGRPLPFDFARESLRQILGGAASAVDRAVVSAMQVRSARDRRAVASMTHAEVIDALEAVSRAYGAAGGEFFDPPAVGGAAFRETRASGLGFETFDLAWPSSSRPYLDAVSEVYLAHVENRTARARLYTRGPGRPAIVAVHGYMGGHWVVEEAKWPVAWLVGLGFDVALPLLPFHGLRASARRAGPLFPSADARFTNEGFRQAVLDLLALVAWLRDRGAESVGLLGMSLGGYTAALAATVSRSIDYVVPILPLASIADYAREQGHLGTGAQALERHGALERANAVVSPLSRPLLLPSTRALVVTAEHDRITPQSHATRLAAHFACDVITVPGSHFVPLGKRETYRAIRAMLEREGFVPPRRAPRSSNFGRSG